MATLLAGQSALRRNPRKLTSTIEYQRRVKSFIIRSTCFGLFSKKLNRHKCYPLRDYNVQIYVHRALRFKSYPLDNLKFNKSAADLLQRVNP